MSLKFNTLVSISLFKNQSILIVQCMSDLFFMFKYYLTENKMGFMDLVIKIIFIGIRPTKNNVDVFTYVILRRHQPC